MSAESSEMTVERNVAIPMRDQTVLRGDLYLPARAGKYPVLVQRTPYNKERAILKLLPPELAVKRGYAVLIQDTRGRFASEGEFNPYRNDAEDGYDTVEWAAGQIWSSGKVGMYGTSYAGATQLLAASAKPPHLVTIVPAITGSSHYNGWVYNGGAFNLVSRLGWTLMMIEHEAERRKVILPSSVSAILAKLNELQGMLFSGSAQKVFDKTEELAQSLEQVLSVLPLDAVPVPRGLASYYFKWLEHGCNDEYWKTIDTGRFYDQVDLPMLHIGGWYDLFTGPTLENYSGFSRYSSKPQCLLMGPWSHGMFSRKVGEIDFGPEADDRHVKLNELHLQWFDHWLKGEANGVVEQIGVSLFVMGENRWRKEAAWPPGRACGVCWYLHSGGEANSLNGDGRLSLEPPDSEPPDRFVYDPSSPVRSVGGNILPLGMVPGPRDQRAVEARCDVLVYTSAPLEQGMEITGMLRMKLWASSTAVDTDFTAKLVDVHPDGYAQNIQDGIIRARFRDSLEHPTPIEPNRPYLFDIDLWSTSHLFRQGHRIRLEISSSSFPHYDRNPNTGGNPASESAGRPARQTVYHDMTHPSHLILPHISAIRQEKL